MSNRTIEAPGVEIVEIDKSEYTRNLVGTASLVLGFASKGEVYEPQQFTSQMAWLNHYGEPTNEAERYFYAASMEVLKQNGKLYTCRLPYDNASLDKLTSIKYTVNGNTPIGNFGEALDTLLGNCRSATRSAKKKRDGEGGDLPEATTPETEKAMVFDKSISFMHTVRDYFLVEAVGLSSEDRITILNYDDCDLLNGKTSKFYLKLNELLANADKNPLRNIEYNGAVVTEPTTYTEYVVHTYGTVSTVAKWAREVIKANPSGTLKEEHVVAFINSLALSEIKQADNLVTSYTTISAQKPTTISLKSVDAYVTGEAEVSTDSFVIVDRLGGAYNDATTRVNSTGDLEGQTKECVGIIPVITTAANALYVQDLIAKGGETFKQYQAVLSAQTIEWQKTEISSTVNVHYNIDNDDCGVKFYNEDPDIESVSKLAANLFPAITYNNAEHFDTEMLKKIGVVVLRAYVDSANNNLINFDVLESFVGSLDKNAKNPATHVTEFLDTIINGSSEYIYFFSNVPFTKTSDAAKSSIFYVQEQVAGSLGFFKEMLEKKISLPVSILKGIATAFEKNEDIHEKAIDIVIDAGISNIAQYIMNVFGNKDAGYYDPTGTEGAAFKLKNKADTQTWMQVINIYENFCRNTRKDCMLVTESLRPFCIQGSKKIIRPSKPSNTIDSSILPNMKYLAGLNTNFAAGYCDWFELADDFTGEYFWCPPSIQAAGRYIYTDNNYNYWDAPAGQKRGVITALDVAFSPSIKQAGAIYNKAWNYAINYADVGIILEGQKTLQQKPTAFDRVNVRRLFLRLERSTYYVLRGFVYEPNNDYTRQRVVDLLTPIFDTVQAKGGIYAYRIICDETINTPQVIDNNELRIKIGIKPTKTAEFIFCQMYALRTGGSWDEMLADD